MNLLKRLRKQKENKGINSKDRVREESLEEIGEGDDGDVQQRDFDAEYDDEIELSNQRLGESSSRVIVMHRLNNQVKKGFEVNGAEDFDEDEVRDIVQNMSENNSDRVSQNTMNRGESDCFTNDSNKLNIIEMLKKQDGINSDTVIHFVNNLPI